jgi:hypothetical protein
LKLRFCFDMKVIGTDDVELDEVIVK